jgi:hypothetical protein
MIATVYIVLFILAVMAITYPEEFPKLIQDPKALLEGIGMETRRRWMILTLGSALWVSKQRLRFSLWRAKPIIEAERAKQKAQKENNID